MDTLYLLILCLSHFSVWYLSSIYSNMEWIKVVKTLKETIQILQKSIELSRENFDIMKKNFVDSNTVKKLEDILKGK